MTARRPLTRRFVVTVSPEEAERLRAFDNKAEGAVESPWGHQMTFVRRRNGTLSARDWTTSGTKGYPTSTARGVIVSDTRVEVEIKARGAWIGWTMIICGAGVVALTFRDGIFALLIGAVLISLGWLGYVSRLTREQPLSELEKVMRRNIRGTWRAVT